MEHSETSERGVLRKRGILPEDPRPYGISASRPQEASTNTWPSTCGLKSNCSLLQIMLPQCVHRENTSPQGWAGSSHRHPATSVNCCKLSPACSHPPSDRRQRQETKGKLPGSLMATVQRSWKTKAPGQEATEQWEQGQPRLG